MPYRDDFDDPSTDKNIAQTLDAVRREVFLRTRGPAVAAGILVFAAIVLAAVIFISYPGSDEPETIPVIQADARPFKVVPDDPGGMAIPHRDSTLFSTMRTAGVEESDEVENLFEEEETEEPMPRSQLFAGLNTEDEMNEIEPAATTKEVLDEGIDDEAEMFGEMKEEATGDFAAQRAADQEIISTIKAEEEAAAMEKVELIQPEESAAAAEPDFEDVVVAPTPAPAPQPEAEETQIAAISQAPEASELVSGSSAAGTHYIQIGAVQSADAAEKGWGAYQKEYSPILTGMSHRVERADLGAKGIYYRIQAGPVSKAKADSVCSAIKEQKPGGCLIVAK